MAGTVKGCVDHETFPCRTAGRSITGTFSFHLISLFPDLPQLGRGPRTEPTTTII